MNWLRDFWTCWKEILTRSLPLWEYGERTAHGVQFILSLLVGSALLHRFGIISENLGISVSEIISTGVFVYLALFGPLILWKELRHYKEAKLEICYEPADVGCWRPRSREGKYEPIWRVGVKSAKGVFIEDVCVEIKSVKRIISTPSPSVEEIPDMSLPLKPMQFNYQDCSFSVWPSKTTYVDVLRYLKEGNELHVTFFPCDVSIPLGTYEIEVIAESPKVRGDIKKFRFTFDQQEVMEEKKLPYWFQPSSS